MSKYADDARVVFDGDTAIIPACPPSLAWRVEVGEHGSRVFDPFGTFCPEYSFKDVDDSIGEIIGGQQ